MGTYIPSFTPICNCSRTYIPTPYTVNNPKHMSENENRRNWREAPTNPTITFDPEMEAIISKQSDLEATMPKSGLGLFLDDILWHEVL